MASEMVQAVAKAIGRQISGGEVSLGLRHDGSENGWIQAARAAIAAMREPTEAMAVAGEDAVLSRPASQKHAAATVWQAMIDEALKDGKP